MAESTLSLTFEDLGRSTAFYLGWKRYATEAEGLTAAQAANVEAANRAGYRDFLSQSDWGFLTPRASFTLWKSVALSASLTAAQSGSTTLDATGGTPFHPSMIGKSIVITGEGTYTITGYTSSTRITVDTSDTYTGKTFSIAADGAYRLPDDFGSMDSERISFAANNQDPRTIVFASELLIVESWQMTTQVQRPAMAAVRMLSNSAGTGQRADLVVAPIPDAAYVVSFHYNVHPGALTTGQYPYGGMKHAETIRLACTAKAEEMFNDHQRMQRDLYAQALVRSKQLDQRQSRAERLGISYEREYGGRNRSERYVRCIGGTVEGVAY
jgi:hypothetical protein